MNYYKDEIKEFFHGLLIFLAILGFIGFVGGGFNGFVEVVLESIKGITFGFCFVFFAPFFASTPEEFRAGCFISVFAWLVLPVLWKTIKSFTTS